MREHPFLSEKSFIFIAYVLCIKENVGETRRIVSTWKSQILFKYKTKFVVNAYCISCWGSVWMNIFNWNIQERNAFMSENAMP